MENATFAAGCFWGVEHCFNKHHRQHGINTRVGYCGGDTEHPLYPEVKKDITGHAESIEITFDPTKVEYTELVEFFYKMHDPTTLNYQGPDVGSQYRSVIFYHSNEQKEIAERVTEEIQKKHYPDQKIVTLIVPAAKFWDAEEYHQLYLEKNPG
ncbi:tubulin-dependent ATPase kip3 [Umbelopsis nana]